MHPHDNPQFKKQLVEVFLKDYNNQKLNLTNDQLELRFASISRSAKLRGAAIGFAGGIFTYVLDLGIKFSYSGPNVWLVRASGICLGFTTTMVAANKLKYSSEFTQVACSLALKYEDQVLHLHPELANYYYTYFGDSLQNRKHLFLEETSTEKPSMYPRIN